MRRIDHPLGQINVLEDSADVPEALSILNYRGPLGADTEGTGLRMYAPGFRVRLLQWGSADTAYVADPHRFGELARTVTTSRPLIWHNFAYDGLAMEASLGIPFHETARVALDSGIASRLIDPRSPDKGGIGHELKNLAAAYLGLDVKDARSVVANHARAEYGLKKDEFWEKIPLDDHVYLEYAGQDPLLTARVGEELFGMVYRAGLGYLADYEHRLAYLLAHLTRIGVLLDQPYIEELRPRFETMYAAANETLSAYGIEATTKTGLRHKAYNKLRPAFAELGVTDWLKMSEKTGVPSCDADTMTDIRLRYPKAAELATSVTVASKAHHFMGYLDGFVGALGADDRVHPMVHPLAAATGRMSVTDPPLQQIPTGKELQEFRDQIDEINSLAAQLRGAFIPEPGHVWLTADLKSVEIRIMAAITQDPGLITDILAGVDPIAVVADEAFGADQGKLYRTDTKRGIYGYSYGGGVAKLALAMGVPQSVVRKVRGGLDARYPGITETRNGMADLVKLGRHRAIAPDGAHLVSERGHSMFNYYVQHMARMMLAESMFECEKRGLIDYLRLLVHDEIDASAPKEQAPEILRELQECMTMEFMGIPVTCEAEIVGERWKKT